MTSAFNFPLDAPIRTGVLLKQGEFGLRLNKKFCILYPNFLVLYENAERWKMDVKDDTLSGRSGAVYLKSARAEEAALGSTKCRHAFSVTAPDARNKKKNLLLIASSDQEREDWITAITRAIPPAKETKVAITPAKPRQEFPEGKFETFEATMTGERGMQSKNVCGVTPGSSQPQTPEPKSESVPLEKEEKRPNETEGQLCASPLEVQSPCSIISQTQSEKDVSSGDATTLLKVLQSKNCCDNERILPPIVLVVEETSAPREKEERSPDPNASCGDRDLPSPLLGGSSCEFNSDDAKISLDNLSTGSLLDAQSRSEGSRSESGDECLDDVLSTGAEKEAYLDLPKEWLRGSSRSSSRSSSYENLTADTAGSTAACPSNCASCNNDPSCDTGCPSQGADSLRGSGDGGSCHSIERVSSELVADALQSSSGDTDRVEKRRDSGCNDTDASCKLHSTSSALSDSLGLSCSNGRGSSVSSGLNNSMSSLLSDSAVFDEDSSDDVCTHASIVQTKGEEESTTIAIDSSRDEPSTAAANLSSTTDNATIGCPGTKVFREKKGFLYKLNENGKGWNPRYLAIYPGYFCYYKNSSSTKPSGVVKLRNSSVLCTATEKRPYQFSVHTESTQNRRNDWVFAAHGKKAMEEWIAAFKLAVQKPL